MRQYEITLNGRTFHVRLLSDPLQEQVEVEVNGQAFTVAVKAAAKAADVVAPAGAVAPSREGVELPSVPLPPPAGQPTEPVTLSGKAVAAPLPGVIKSIAIRPGQQVSAGDPLLVIEAMKMDNVLRASREGIVETIHTAEGRQVAHGELLLEYQD